MAVAGSNRLGWRGFLSVVAVFILGAVLALVAASGVLYVETLVLANDAALWIWWSCPLVAALIVVIVIGIFAARKFGRRTIRV